MNDLSSAPPSKPLSIDLYTASQPNILACILVLALDQQRRVAFNKLDFMNLTCILKGVEWESGSDAFVLVDEWLDNGLKHLRPLLNDKITLDNPLAAVALLERAHTDGIVDILPESRVIDGNEYFSPPTPYILEIREELRRRNPDPDDPKQLHRWVFPVGDPTGPDRYTLMAQLEHRATLFKLDISQEFLKRFPSPHFTFDVFIRHVVKDSFLHSLGATLVDKADITTANSAYYEWLRDELFVPLDVQALRRTSVLADAVSVDAQHTTVYDVLKVLERHREWSTFRKLEERIEARQSAAGDLVVYGIEEAAGLIGPPLTWLVKLGSFLVRKLRRPR